MTSLSLDQSHTLLTSFNGFLTVAIHNILYYRSIYPQETFLSTRAYNLPVHQNRHPRVCAWIRDAVDAVAAQLAGGNVARVAVVIHSPMYSIPLKPGSSSPSPSSPSPLSQPSITSSDVPSSSTTLEPGTVLERWLFDVSSFPAWPSKDPPTNVKPNSNDPKSLPVPGGAPAKAMRDHGRLLSREAREEEARDRQSLDGADGVSWADVDEQLRGALRRMAHAAEGMVSLPEGCSFTVAVELREDGKAPIGHPQDWIPSEPRLQPASQGRSAPAEDVGGAKTTPIRAVGAGPLFFECWVEESRAKEMLNSLASDTRKPVETASDINKPKPNQNRPRST